MNRIKYIVLLCVLILGATRLNAAMNCMDNSYHLKQAYDNKNYHYVQCNCPCPEYPNFSNRGQCLQCQHYHVPKDWSVISGDKITLRIQQTKPVHSIEQIEVLPQTRTIIKQMVANYKRQNKK